MTPSLSSTCGPRSGRGSWRPSGSALDARRVLGVNAPASWITNGAIGLVPAAVAAGNTYAEGTSGVDLAEDINQTIALVEADGYDATVGYSRRTLRARLRGLRDDNGQPIIQAPTAGAIGAEHLRCRLAGGGQWLLGRRRGHGPVPGDPRYAILGLRQDITYKFLDQATVTIGDTLVSLAENDLIGLRFQDAGWLARPPRASRKRVAPAPSPSRPSQAAAPNQQGRARTPRARPAASWVIEEH